MRGTGRVSFYGAAERNDRWLGVVLVAEKGKCAREHIVGTQLLVWLCGCRRYWHTSETQEWNRGKMHHLRARGFLRGGVFYVGGALCLREYEKKLP